MVFLGVGVGFLAASAWMYASSMVRENTHNWQPLVMPVSLIPGIIRTPEIQTDRDGEYGILIDLEEKFGMHRMECQLGPEGSNSGSCEGIASLIDISWELFERKKIVAEGSSGDIPPGINWSSTIERLIGKFKAQKGHRYTLVLDIKRDASELNVANPKIEIEVDRGISKDYAVGTHILRLEAVILGLLGITVLVSLVRLRRRIRRDIRPGSENVH